MWNRRAEYVVVVDITARGISDILKSASNHTQFYIIFPKEMVRMICMQLKLYIVL